MEITQVKNVIDAPTIVFYQNLACDEIKNINHLLSERKLAKLIWYIETLCPKIFSSRTLFWVKNLICVG